MIFKTLLSLLPCLYHSDLCSAPHLVLFPSVLPPIVSSCFFSFLFSLCSLLIWKTKNRGHNTLIFSISSHRYLSFPFSSCLLSYCYLCYLSLVFKAFLNLSLLIFYFYPAIIFLCAAANTMSCLCNTFIFPIPLPYSSD